MCSSSSIEKVKGGGGNNFNHDLIWFQQWMEAPIESIEGGQ